MSDTYQYYTDRQIGPRSPTYLKINEVVWDGIKTLVDRSITKGDFGNAFPERCSDSPSTCCGTDGLAFERSLKAEIPSWSGWNTLPDIGMACDFLEFCHRHIALAQSFEYHGFLKHNHFRFDVAKGKQIFRNEVNLILQRNGMAFRMIDEGRMERLLADPTGEVVCRAVFRTSDDKLDELLYEARAKFLSPHLRIRKEALERAWDAWERLKTVKDADKKQGTRALLDDCSSEPNMREILETEARLLTDFGNRFHIRHSETNQTSITDEDHVDYVFQRIFAMLLLVLRKHDMLK